MAEMGGGDDSSSKPLGFSSSKALDSTFARVSNAIERGFESLYSTILTAPRATLILVVLLTIWTGGKATEFEKQIRGDVEIYLPEDAPSTDLLLEVREEWSTDIVLVYVQTSNALYGDTGPSSNITSVSVLKEMSSIEGDDSNRGAGHLFRGADWDKEDRGRNDGVVWTLSISQFIKEANSSDGRFIHASCSHGLESRLTLIPCDDVTDGPWGNYDIPNQDQVDRIITQLEGSLKSLVVDSNGDGIWDTAPIIFGIHHDMEVTGNFADHREFIAHLDESLEVRPTRHTKMTTTGLTPVLYDVSDEVYLQLKHMMPISIGLVILALAGLHMNPKVVVITGLPIFMSLAVTFGATVIFDMMLTPMIIAAGPILIGLGVDYALHMTNRIEEARNRLLDEAAEKNRELRIEGMQEVAIPDPWDLDLYRKAVVETVMTTGHAIFLSAVTTIIGFSVLIVPAITPIVPMRTVGSTLVIGIASTLIFSILLVPILVLLLRYRKRRSPKGWKSISQWPIKRGGTILIITLLISVWGAMLVQEEMNKPITGSDETPEGIESMDRLVEYSETFNAGQTNMFMVDAKMRGESNGTTPIRDLPVLDALDEIQNRVDDVEETSTTSVITFLKSIEVSIPLSEELQVSTDLWSLLHHRCWTSDDLSDLECLPWMALDAPDGEGRARLRGDLVDVSLDTLSVEVRSMLLNEAESKTLVYTEQPYMNLIRAEGLREIIDGILAEGVTEPDVSTSALAGGLPISLDINEGIHDTQRDTTFITLGVLTLVMMILFRSPRLGLFTMIPVAVVVLWQPLLMRGGDVNVNVFTAMVGTIVFGIGVDDAIHITQRIREEGETADGIMTTVSRTGQTLMETSITTIMGLAAGFFVAFPGLQNFFVLIMLLIAFALATSVFMLPSLLTIWNHWGARMRGEPDWRDITGGVRLEESSVIDADVWAES